MKRIGIIHTTALFLLLGIGFPADARQDKQEEKAKPGKPEQQAKPERQKQDNSAKQQEQARAQQDQQRQQRNNSAKQEQQQAKTQQQEQRQQQQDKSNKHEQQIAKGQEDQQRQQQQQRQDDSSQRQEQARVQQSPAQTHQQQVAWQGDRARSWKSEHRTWQQRGGYNGYRVPDDRFRSYYGQDHGFRINSLPVVFIGGRQRFQYGGYWFGLVDPWPEYWSNDWYDSDDVYVDYYDDGYYLYNRRYPGDRISISFYLN